MDGEGRGRARAMAGMASLALGAAMVGPVAAGESAVGDELELNAYTTDSQQFPRAQAADDGSFVVTWKGRGFGDDLTGGVQVRRFAADGTPRGLEIQVNSYTTGNEGISEIAVAPGGAFVVVWDQDATDGSDTDGASVKARAFDSSGTPLTGAVQVNAYTTGDQEDPAVGVDSSGNVVVVWRGAGGDETEIFGRRIAGGGGIGPEFRVNADTSGRQEDPSVAVRGDGSFVVAWSSLPYDYSGLDEDDIVARRFGSNGAPMGGDIAVHAATLDRQDSPELALDPLDGFVIVWRSWGGFANDADESVVARRFDGAGAALGAPFQVNDYTTGRQENPRIAMDPSRRFVVVWSSSGSPGSDDLQESVQARRFESDGSPIGAQFQVNAYTTNSQGIPAVVPVEAGKFMTIWQTQESGLLDTDGRSIHARLVELMVFTDGFESGDTLRWDDESP